MAKRVALEDMSGEWVLLQGERVLAHDPDIVVVLRKAKDHEGEDIMVLNVMAGQDCYY